MADVPDTPWRAATAQRRSQRQEEKLGKLPGGRKQLNSGRHWHSKRDVRLGGFLVEARTTEKKTYPIDVTEFRDIERQAIGTPPGQLPAMQIDFDYNGSTTQLFVKRLEDELYQQQRIATLEAQLEEAKRGNS